MFDVASLIINLWDKDKSASIVVVNLDTNEHATLEMVEQINGTGSEPNQIFFYVRDPRRKKKWTLE